MCSPSILSESSRVLGSASGIGGTTPFCIVDVSEIHMSAKRPGIHRHDLQNSHGHDMSGSWGQHLNVLTCHGSPNSQAASQPVKICKVLEKLGQHDDGGCELRAEEVKDA